MSGLSETERYKKGENRKVDEKFSAYKKISVWSGPAINKALTEGELDIMADLWRKEQQTPWKLSVQDVLTLGAGISFLYV